jgi:hypothetical protein
MLFLALSSCASRRWVWSKNSADLYLQEISTRLILRFSQLQPLQCPRFIRSNWSAQYFDLTGTGDDGEPYPLSL